MLTDRRSRTIALRARFSLAFVLTLFFVPAYAEPVTLVLQGTQGGHGQTVTMPVLLGNDGTNAVSGMQFDVVFDAELLQLADVTSGPSALGASKDVQFSVLEQGRLRVVVAGLNQNVIEEGEVAGLVYGIFPKKVPVEDSTLVAIEDLVIADPNGDAVPAVGLGAEIMLWFSAVPAAGKAAIVCALLCCVLFGVRKCGKVHGRVT